MNNNSCDLHIVKEFAFICSLIKIMKLTVDLYKSCMLTYEQTIGCVGVFGQMIKNNWNFIEPLHVQVRPFISDSFSIAYSCV